jgi:arabinose-5-phosphate isomerase
MTAGLKRDRLLRDDRGDAIASASRTLQLETEGLSALKAALADRLIDSFAEAIELLRGCRGRIIVTGMGKSGHVGLKVAATLSSTGTPAFFVHPSEASHGDLGMITKQDVILAFSWSGETVELGNLVSYSRRFAVPLIAVTSNPDSTLGTGADLVLALPQAKEACPHGLAPTTSTVMQLALGDCLAMALLDS